MLLSYRSFAVSFLLLLCTDCISLQMNRLQIISHFQLVFDAAQLFLWLIIQSTQSFAAHLLYVCVCLNLSSFWFALIRSIDTKIIGFFCSITTTTKNAQFLFKSFISFFFFFKSILLNHFTKITFYRLIETIFEGESCECDNLWYCSCFLKKLMANMKNEMMCTFVLLCTPCAFKVSVFMLK